MKAKTRRLPAVFLWGLFAGILSGCTAFNHSATYPALPDRVLLAEVPFFPQQEYQCGPAALATILVYRQVDITPELLVSRIYLPGRHGTLAPEIVAEVRRHDLLPYPLEPDLEYLLTEIAAGNPVLVMQNLGLSWYPQWHYAVVIGYDLDGQYLVLRSGVEAERKITLRNFESTWRRANHWALVIPLRGRLPATANILSWLEGAQDLAATGHMTGAHEAYKLASVGWPDDPLAWFVLGNSFYQQQQLTEAEAAYRKGLAIRQDAPETLNNLAYTLLALGCQPQALQAAHCALVYAPDNKNVNLTLREMENHQPSKTNGLHCKKVSC